VNPRRPPELIIRLPLEGSASVIIAADSHEDELRLRGWLRRCGQLGELAALLPRLLDYLDDTDEARTA
jgi:hypothetical protein